MQEMPDKIMLLRNDYKSYYAYRKAIKEYRAYHYTIAIVGGGVICFRYSGDYATWKNQK